MVGTATGKTGRLCGVYKGGYRYHDQAGKRQLAKALAWVSAHLYVRTTVRA